MKIEEKGDNLVITDFDQQEAYRIACKIEKDGIGFYEKLAAESTNPAVREKLEFLLQEEKKHLVFFTERFYALNQNSKDDFEQDNLLDYMDYGVFQPYQSIQEMTRKLDDLHKALRLGIIVEEKTVKFYQACKQKTSSAQTGAELENIIKEEKTHQQLLEQLLNQIKT